MTKGKALVIKLPEKIDLGYIDFVKSKKSSQQF